MVTRPEFSLLNLYCATHCASICANILFWRIVIATNLDIDNELIEEAMKLGDHRTKRGVVEEALKEYVQQRNQRKITDLFGTISYDQDYDYKKQRQRG